ncbi:hypothetical protein MYX84_05925, partial [Acidobacteria bacterium AH-259-O06]|nr:hypothetical protein [Acidobacteria bacterium AH-259-O06]
MGKLQQEQEKSPPARDGGERLDSWKKIAVYLDRDVRTVHRWEKKEGLPVHRHVHDSLATVYAYRSEIDTWLANRRPELEKDGLPHWFTPLRENKKTLGGITIGTLLVLLIGLVWWTTPDLFAPNKPAPSPLRKFVISPPSSAPLRFRGGPPINLAISPDGRRIVYIARRDGTTQLYVRPLDDFVARPIPGTEGTQACPFFSPDGEWVGFFADGKLKKVSLRGGPPITLCDAAGSWWLAGSWSPQNEIVFSAGLKRGDVGVYRVSA